MKDQQTTDKPTGEDLAKSPGRPKTSCVKCHNDKKACIVEHSSDGNILGCYRCISLKGVRHCSLSSSQWLFNQIKNKANETPNELPSDSEAELPGGDVVATVASAEDKDDDSEGDDDDSITTMGTIEAIAFDEDALLSDPSAEEDLIEMKHNEAYQGSKFVASLTNEMSAKTFLANNQRTIQRDHDLFQPVFRYAQTNCRGSARLFSIVENDNPKLWVEEIHKRLIYDSSIESPAFLETWNFPSASIKDGCRNKLVAFKDKYYDYWKLGVIESIDYKVLDERDVVLDGIINIQAWAPKKSDKPLPMPGVFRCSTWEQAEQHFEKRIYILGAEQLELVFLNQVLGPLHLGAKDDTINMSDGAVQASPSGPDTFLPLMPRPMPPPRSPIKRIDLHHPDLFKKQGDGSYLTKQYSKAYSQDPYIQRFIRFNHCVYDESSPMKYCVINDLDGNKVPLDEMKQVNQKLKGKLVIPSIISEQMKHNPMRFFVMSKSAVEELKHMFNGVPMDDAVMKYEAEVRNEQMIPPCDHTSKFNNRILSPKKANRLCSAKMEWYIANVNDDFKLINASFYWGSSCPNFTPQWSVYLDFDRQRELRILQSHCGLHNDRVPISVAYVTSRTQNRQFDAKDVELMIKAAGSKAGTFPSRSCIAVRGGFQTYLGKRSPQCVTAPTVSQGPGILNEYQYGRKYCNPLYMPFLLKSLNFVIDKSISNARFFYKHLHVSSHFKHSHLWIGDMTILTINFSNTTHCDKRDQFPTRVDSVVNECDSVMNHEDESVVTKTFKKQAAAAACFTLDTQCAVPTTCCYQRINLDNEGTDNIKDHYYFIMDGIMSAHKIVNHLTHTWCASIFQHNTAVPVYSEDHGDGSCTVTIGEHPRIAFLAWGGTPKDGTATTASERRSSIARGRRSLSAKKRASVSKRRSL